MKIDRQTPNFLFGGAYMNEQQFPLPENTYTGTGYIIVKVATASGAIPVEGVTVIVRGNEDQNSAILLSFLTDRDGLTPRAALPAPSREESQSPNGKRPFSTYNIDVLKEGYYPQYYQNVPVFDGITAVQTANIIPISEGGERNPYTVDEQIFDQYQNPML